MGNKHFNNLPHKHDINNLPLIMTLILVFNLSLKFKKVDKNNFTQTLY